MTFGALVVQLSADPALSAAVVAALSSDERVTLGAAVGDRLPVVATTASAADGAELVEELTRLPGVVWVDVVSVVLDDDGEVA
jgi:DNA-binding IclR family transcriptional regulator